MENRFKHLFDWETFQKQFFNEGYWQEALRNETGTATWLDQYVQQLIADTLPKVHSNFKENSKYKQTSTNSPIRNIQIFETHRSVIVRVKVSPQTDIERWRFFIGINELVIKGIATEEDKKIKLPVNVRYKGSKVVYKNKIFEVRMPKRKQVKLREILPIYID